MHITISISDSLIEGAHVCSLFDLFIAVANHPASTRREDTPVICLILAAACGYSSEAAGKKKCLLVLVLPPPYLATDRGGRHLACFSLFRTRALKQDTNSSTRGFQFSRVKLPPSKERKELVDTRLRNQEIADREHKITCKTLTNLFLALRSWKSIERG